MQRGVIVRHNKSWTLLYWDVQIRSGERKRVRVRKKLARIGSEYPTKQSVRHLADDLLAPINRKQLQPESSLLVTDFITDYYFPQKETELRPMMLNYKTSIYEKHLKDRLGKLTLREARTVHFQKLMRTIPNVSHLTLLHIKNFLSGVFKYAKQEGLLDGINPVQDVSVPARRQKKFEGRAYSLEEVDRMLEDLDQLADPTAVEVIGLLSLTGLRQSEARGLRWSDWDEQAETLQISRSVWGRHVGPTKNPASEERIPVLPLLAGLLQQRRDRVKGKPDDYIFAHNAKKRGTPLNFHNLENRVIKPEFERRRLLKADGQTPAPGGIEWAGWHGFRRGLATNLFDLNVHPKIIAGIMRHSDVATTLRHYIREGDQPARGALATLDARIKERQKGNVLVQGKPAGGASEPESEQK